MSTNETITLYTPLSRNEVRYLVLLPGRIANPIQCRLIKGSDLPANVPYQAFSYEWGCPQPESSIIVNGVKTKIRDNLWLALRSLRRAEAKRLMWVDAICLYFDRY
jgi:hypothetical protein